ncbi:hypothetical protein ACFSFZ_07870 [Mixta tenebrionis]|uniref:Uncharacterized protein n=1 Tax=Mixta tenebrionis TaxID=2562439 RepID=A0A506V4N5_9GAMM|nr:hypothetical protein [Mixta tenebrionis]TPW40841.1 hypothetical protein FKM52_16775 [Mixta tenebrionis]
MEKTRLLPVTMTRIVTAFMQKIQLKKTKQNKLINIIPSTAEIFPPFPRARFWQVDLRHTRTP